MEPLQERFEKNIPKGYTGKIPSDFVRSSLESGKFFSKEKHEEKLEFHRDKILRKLPTNLTRSQWLDDAVFIYGYFNQSTGIDKLIDLLNNKQYDKALELVSTNKRVSWGLRHMMHILLREGLKYIGINTSYVMPPAPPEYTTSSGGGSGKSPAGGSLSGGSGASSQGTSTQTPPESVESIMREESKYQEKEKKEKNIIMIVGIVVGLIIVALIAYYFYKKKSQ